MSTDIEALAVGVPEAPPAENPQAAPTVEPAAHVDEDAAAHLELMAALSQSVSGAGLSGDEVGLAKQNGLEYERSNPADAAAWESWMNESADNLGYGMAKLARGELPVGPPSAHAAELEVATRQHAARRELEALYAASPPGSEAYRSDAVQKRVAALNYLVHGGESVVNGRRLV